LKRFLICITLAILLPALTGIAGDQPWIEVQERQLPNGLTLLMVEDHSAPIINYQAWFGVGARLETGSELGLSHMFEHMMFRGSHKYEPEEHSEIITANGGRLNAYTSEDVTVYYETIAANKLELVIALEAERMQNLRITDEILATEQQVVLNERRQRVDNSTFGTLYEQLYANAFQVHSYRNPILGWMENIENYTAELCREFYRTWYVPGNCTLIITGDLDPDQAFRFVKKYYGPIPAQEPPYRPPRQELPQRGERRVVYHMPTQMPMVAIGYHSPALSDPDFFPLRVLETILTEGESSRLHKRLVLEEQLAAWIGGGVDPMLDPGLFTFWLTPLPTVEPTAAENAIYEELARLAKEPVSKRELQKARNMLESDIIFNLQDASEKSYLVGHFYHRAGDWRRVNDYLDNINAVTVADLQRCAARYFTDSNRTVVTILPETAGDQPMQSSLGGE